MENHLLLATLISASLVFGCYILIQIGETCSQDINDCDLGLQCIECNSRNRCTRIQTISPISMVMELPFNRYSWLTTHNSFATRVMMNSSIGSSLLTITNQEDSITDQLNQPAINALEEIKAFLIAHPTEIITIFIKDHVTSPNGVNKVFNKARLRKFWFPVSKMPKNGSDWPTVKTMISKNHRLIVFTSNATKEASERIAYEWNYVVENQYGMGEGSCLNRAESFPMNTSTKSLVLMNYFRNVQNYNEACMDNSSPLISMMDICFKAAGNRWPNFIAVDFYKRGDGRGAPYALDVANQNLFGT
ncbi:PLC-like phosphodiesterase, TIM beta/alpha-barrel domain superfamily [Sesbania bispinosa]|nr:PLC-like phosphodiesterase, TIM beta/alpha-barrel domain superfamily [Sesbania bispinosa]